MRKTFFEEKPKFLKISKAKPLQLKRNLLIEKYIDSYIIENKNQSKLKNSKIEENKENYFPRKTQVIKQKLSLQESEDTQSTTLNLNCSSKGEKSANKLYKFPLKVRTKSSSGRTNMISSNISVYKKNIVNNCFLKNASNLKKNHSYNKNITQKYDRKNNYMSKYLNEYNNISAIKNQNNSLVFAKKIKRENTFTKYKKGSTYCNL